MSRQRFRRSLGVRAAAANGSHPAIWLNHVALSAQQEGLLLVANQQERLQMAKKFIGSLVFGELNRAAP